MSMVGRTRGIKEGNGGKGPETKNSYEKRYYEGEESLSAPRTEADGASTSAHEAVMGGMAN